MSLAVIGMIAGMALGFAGYFGGFGAFLLVAALGAVGFVDKPVPGGGPGAGRLLPCGVTTDADEPRGQRPSRGEEGRSVR